MEEYKTFKKIFVSERISNFISLLGGAIAVAIICGFEFLIGNHILCYVILFITIVMSVLMCINNRIREKKSIQVKGFTRAVADELTRISKAQYLKKGYKVLTVILAVLTLIGIVSLYWGSWDRNFSRKYKEESIFLAEALADDETFAESARVIRILGSVLQVAPAGVKESIVEGATIVRSLKNLQSEVKAGNFNSENPNHIKDIVNNSTEKLSLLAWKCCCYSVAFLIQVFFMVCVTGPFSCLKWVACQMCRRKAITELGAESFDTVL